MESWNGRFFPLGCIMYSICLSGRPEMWRNSGSSRKGSGRGAEYFLCPACGSYGQSFCSVCYPFYVWKISSYDFWTSWCRLGYVSGGKTRKRKAVAGLLLSAALTSMLTGITEPLEFTFLFVAPLMYAVHCIFAGFAYMLMHILNVGVGMTFSGGLIDMFLFGILQGNKRQDGFGL